MYAVVSSGGKQYRVEPGSTLIVERLAAEPGTSVTFDRVLMVGDGDEVTIGTPLVSGASVSGTVLGEELGPKIVIFKFKQKVKYRRRSGHRQHLTRVRIDEISADGRKRRQKAAPKPAKVGEEAEVSAPKRRRSSTGTTRSRAVSAEETGTPEAAAEAAEEAPKKTRTRRTARPKADAVEE
jgi:large subunit ribosomal protein L21